MNSSWGSGADGDANLGAQVNLSVDHSSSVASVVQHGATLATTIPVGDVIVQIDSTQVTESHSLVLTRRWQTITLVIQSLFIAFVAART